MATKTQYIYGSGNDLSSAIKNYGNNPDYKFVDVSQSGFDPSSMKSGGWLLGGDKVNTNITNDALATAGVKRLAGNNSNETAGVLANATGTKYVYGSGNDLNNFRATVGNNKNYKLIDVSAQGFDPNSMVAGSVLLGGSGVNTNINDNLLSALNIGRLAGQNSNETADKASQYYVNSLIPETPQHNQFEFSGTMQDYLDQAQTALKPQLELAQNNINDNYDTNYIPQANNDSLKRGLARSSYAGNRVDQLNSYRDKALNQALLENLQQANTLGLQNYNVAYDRAYQLNRDENAYNQQNYQNQMGLYSNANQNYWQNKNYNNENDWKQKQYNLSLDQFNTQKDQWNKTFEYQKQQDSIANALRGSGGSGGSGGRKSSGSGSSKSSSSSQKQVDEAAYDNFNALSSPQDQYALLHNSDFTSVVSASMQKSLKSAYEKNLKNYVDQASSNAKANGVESDMDYSNADSWMKASQPTWDYANSPYTIYSGGR